MNSVAQNVFSDYFGWSAYAPKAGMIPIHKTVLGLMLDKLSENDVIEIADFFAKVKVKNMTLVLRNEYSTKSFLEVFEAWLKSSSLIFTRQVNHDTEVYTITHEMGSKWSTYLSHMLQTIFDDMGLNEVIIEKTEDIVMFRIPLLISRNDKSIIVPNRQSLE